MYNNGSVAELVDAVDLKSIDPRSCGFDPRPSHHLFNALVAQWLEQGSHKPLVVGSSPTGRTKRNSGIINKKVMYDLILVLVATIVLITLSVYTSRWRTTMKMPITTSMRRMQSDTPVRIELFGPFKWLVCAEEKQKVCEGGTRHTIYRWSEGKGTQI